MRELRIRPWLDGSDGNNSNHRSGNVSTEANDEVTERVGIGDDSEVTGEDENCNCDSYIA